MYHRLSLFLFVSELADYSVPFDGSGINAFIPASAEVTRAYKGVWTRKHPPPRTDTVAGIFPHTHCLGIGFSFFGFALVVGIACILFPPLVSIAVCPNRSLVFIPIPLDGGLFFFPGQIFRLFAMSRASRVPVWTALAWVVAVT